MRILTALAIAALAVAAPAAEGPFGVVCPWGGLGESGIGWVRCGAGATALGNWASIHKGPGAFDWTASDNELKDVLSQGMSPLVILGYTPDWLSAAREGKEAYPPSDYLQFHDFVSQAVRRYAGKVSYWEVWNEPDIGFFKGSVQQYVNLLKTGANAIRSADPKGKVVFGGLAGVNIAFLEQAYDCGAGPYFDVMAVHPYQWGDTFNDGWFVLQLADLRRAMNEQGDTSKPIWLTELGWSTGDSSITDDVQARLLVQAVVTSLTLEKLGVERMFWFCVKDWGGAGYGLLDVDGKPKPAFRAYSGLIRTLKGYKYVGSVDVGADARLHVFSSGGSQIGVLWSADKQTREVSIAVGPGGAPEAFDLAGAGVEIGLVGGGRLSIQAKPDPTYIRASFPEVSRKHESQWPAYKPIRAAGQHSDNSWMTLMPQQGTSVPFAVRGKRTDLTLRVQNASAKPLRTCVAYRLLGEATHLMADVTVAARSENDVKLPLTITADAATGLRDLLIQPVGAQGLRGLRTPVRISDGAVIEVVANSFPEEALLIGERSCGGAPGVRFGSSWTYRLPVEPSRSYRLLMNVGAHEAGRWKVSCSSDGQSFEEAMSGNSNRAWRSCRTHTEPEQLWLYAKVEGTNAQVGALRLEPVR